MNWDMSDAHWAAFCTSALARWPDLDLRHMHHGRDDPQALAGYVARILHLTPAEAHDEMQLVLLPTEQSIRPHSRTEAPRQQLHA